MSTNRIFDHGDGFLVPSSGTPKSIINISEVTAEESKETKAWQGGKLVEQDAAVTKIMLSGTAKIFAPDVATLAAFANGTEATGSRRVKVNETSTVPGTPYQITVDESATFLDDLGVKNATTDVPLTKVASSPATGEYAVAAGVYEFAAADEGVSVAISYSYTDTAGTKLTASNGNTSAVTEHKLYATNQYQGETTLYCSRVYFTSVKPIYASKENDDINEYAATWNALADASGDLYDLSVINP